MNPINFRQVSSSQDSLFTQQEYLKKQQLKSASEELEINSPDSVAIAKIILEAIGIVIKPLNELHELQQKTKSKGRNEAFAKQVNQLKEEAAVSALALQTLAASSSQASALSSSFSSPVPASERGVQGEEEFKTRGVAASRLQSEAEFGEFNEEEAARHEKRARPGEGESAFGSHKRARFRDGDEKLAVESAWRGEGDKKLVVGSVEPIFDYRNQNWSQVYDVIKANAGSKGAWFYINLKGKSVVIKGQQGAKDQLMGTTLLRLMGISAPDLRIVKRSSLEGAEISKRGKPHGLNSSNPDDPYKLPDEYIVMDRVMGKSYDDLIANLEINKFIEIVSSNLKTIGELAVYDLVLQNADRFDLTDDSGLFNGGNFMFDGAPKLWAIDTDCPTEVDQDSVDAAEGILEEIVQGDVGEHVDNMLSKLTSDLNKKVEAAKIEESFQAEEELEEEAKEEAAETVKFSLHGKELVAEGMKTAVENLKDMDIKWLEESFVNLCRKGGGEVSALPGHVKHLIEVIKTASVQS